jgi:ABC-type Co2+ transport system permease subunit
MILSCISFIVLILAYIRAKRGKEKEISLLRMNIVPIFIIAMVVVDIGKISNVSLTTVIWFAISILIGIIIGVIRCKMIEFRFDKENSKLSYLNSTLGLKIAIAILIIKIVVRYLFKTSGIALVVSNGLLLITCATIISRRVYIFYKYLSFKKGKN